MNCEMHIGNGIKMSEKEKRLSAEEFLFKKYNVKTKLPDWDNAVMLKLSDALEALKLARQEHAVKLYDDVDLRQALGEQEKEILDLVEKELLKDNGTEWELCGCAEGDITNENEKLRKEFVDYLRKEIKAKFVPEKEGE